MFTKMLVPLDGSEVSEGILPWVTHVAKNLNIPVVLMSIMDPKGQVLPEQVATPSLSLHMGRLPFLTLAADRLDNMGISRQAPQYDHSESDGHPKRDDIEEMVQLEQWLRERASMLEVQGVEVAAENIVTAHDKPSRVILQFAWEHGCDLIAMATHERNLLERTFQSSVTNEVIRSGNIPVLAIMPEQTESPHQPAITTKLTVLLDGSEFAESVLPYVEELGRRLSLEVVLIRWLDNSQQYPGSLGAGSAAVETDRSRVEAEPEATKEAEVTRDYLQSTAANLSRAGLKARWEMRGGGFEAVRSGLSQECAGSIIVLASHGRSGLSRWIEGSVAEDLLRNPGCPLLIIPSALAQQQEAEDQRA